jgi:hypothetical protein
VGDLVALVSKGGADSSFLPMIGLNIVVSSSQDHCADFVLIHVPGDRPASDKVGLVSPVANLLKIVFSFNYILLK